MANERLAQAKIYADRLREDRGICACCEKIIRGKAAIDHNHVTRKRRALVCYPCNALIGYMEWIIGNPEKAQMIRTYLAKHDPDHELAFKDVQKV